MKRLVAALMFVIFLLSASAARAATIAPEEITEDTTWIASSSPYHVSRSVFVAPDVTLTIEPGVEVDFDNYDAGMFVMGSLQALGTGEAPIRFSSPTHPERLGWEGITFFSDSTSTLDHVHVSYANSISDDMSAGIILRNSEFDHFAYGIDTTEGHVLFDHDLIHDMYLDSIRADGGEASLTDVTIRNAVFGPYFSNGENSTITNSTIDTVITFGFAAFNNAHVQVASTTLSNIGSDAVEVQLDSSADISRLLVVGYNNSDVIDVSDNASTTVRNSKFATVIGQGTNMVTRGGTLAFDHSTLTGASLNDCFTLQDGGTLSITDSTISGCTRGAGVYDAGSTAGEKNSLTLTNSEITGSKVGLELDSGSSTYAITNNSIHGNVTGLVHDATSTIDVRNNYWGDPSGPYTLPGNPIGKGDAIVAASSTVQFEPWLTSWGASSDPCALGTCVSNVLFLPGIEGSRLYRPGEEGEPDKLWEPSATHGNSDVADLFLKPDGTSRRSDIYAKERDVIDEVPVLGTNIYKSFIAKMDALKAAGTLNDWEPVSYDWRLSLGDILQNGNDIDGKIYYSGDRAATSTPYILQELRRLAATSQTGKVTIVAHSYGGLVAKRLTEMLGPDASKLIDKMVFVAVPQAGTPTAIAASMHGYGQDLGRGYVLSKATARTFASTSPTSYNLLPSANYFTQVDDPVITIDASLPDWIARYGQVIHSAERLHTFLTDPLGKVASQTGDVNQPILDSAALLTNAEAMHSDLDQWTPPTGIALTQIAGWGVPSTVSGLTYKKDTTIKVDPTFTVDGDGTVVVPSALWTSTTTGVKNYWMNLDGYSKEHYVVTIGDRFPFNHSDILETDPVLNFIADQIASTTKPLSDYTYLSTASPSSTDKRLRYALHSPLLLNLYDDQGRHTGIATSTGQVEEQIPGTYYAELGDAKYIFSDTSSHAHVVMNGYAPGTFTFNLDQFTGDTRTASTTFKDIPTTSSTVVVLDVAPDITAVSPMRIDSNGDGQIDATLAPKLNGVVTLPRDTTPPELKISFDTALKALSVTALDESGPASVTSTTTYPALKKNRGTATTVLTARDVAGNTTKLVYTEQLPSPLGRDTIMPISLSYNNSVPTQLPATKVSYKWRTNKAGAYTLFATNLHSGAASLESHYRPKKLQTVLMMTPQELDDADEDIAADIRPVKLTLPGMVVPYMTTKKGGLFIGY